MGSVALRATLPILSPKGLPPSSPLSAMVKTKGGTLLRRPTGIFFFRP
jgi:hypothetical protein